MPSSEKPDLSAPSPADRPTPPERPAPTAGELERTTTPSEPETEWLDGGTDGAFADDNWPPGPIGAPTRSHATRPAQTGPGFTRIEGAWVGLIAGAIILIFLLVFILQNLDPAQVQFLGMQAELPLGIWLLFAAIAGVLLLAVPGLIRMRQWRKAGRPPRTSGRGR